MPNYHYTTRPPSYSFGHPWTPAIKFLIIFNALLFLLKMVFSQSPWFNFLGIQSPEMFTYGRFWQPLTYLFVHHDFWHLAFNMLALWMFGCDVEKVLGTKNFYYYYLATGVLTGVVVALVARLAGEHSLTVGASGAIFAVLLAYGILFAERTITLLLFLVIPVTMKAKTMVIIFAIIEFIAGVGNIFGQVSHLAHLSGLLIGYLYFMLLYPNQLRQLDLFRGVRRWWRTRHIKLVDSELQVDQILEKISKVGINALSKKERQILSEASRRRHDHHPEDN